MTDNQTNRYNMLVAVMAVLQSFKDVWKSRKTFAAGVAKLETILENLKTPMEQRGRDNRGIATGKKAQKLRAARKADYIGDVLQGYAMDAEDDDLYRAMMFSADDIMKLAAPLAAAKMREVHTAATALFGDHLSGEGLDQDDLDELQEAADAFEGETPKVRTAIGEKKDAGEDIDEGISTGVEIAHRLDKSIATFGSASSSFVSQYRSARIIVDAGHGKRKPQA